MTNRLFFLLSLFIIMSSFNTNDKSIITIYLIGNSTMASKSLIGGNLERGWGQMLPGFFSENIRIENYAIYEVNSKSFIDEGQWDKVITQVKKGDYIFIQFDHNEEIDNINAQTILSNSFYNNLKQYVNEARAKGAIPVLISSILCVNCEIIEKASSNKENKRELSLRRTHNAYLNVPSKVAKELGVLFIDLNQITHKYVERIGTEKAKKHFMHMGINYCNNTHLTVSGARKIADLAIDAIKEQIPILAKEVRNYDFVVAQDGSGDFFTIQNAINAVPDFRKNARTTILIRSGDYQEKVVIPESKINISLIGEEGAVLTNNDYAQKENIFGEEMSTSGSSTCYIYAPDFYAENITFKNSAGPVGQAVACFISGDRAFFKKCRFLGNQDTLYTYSKGDRQYFEDCYIEGTVDFIFGWSIAIFNRCNIHSKSDGFITAPSTDAGQAYGYIFYDCKLTGDSIAENVYLSRPWRPYAQAVFIHCEMGRHILPIGWHNWDKKEVEQTVVYAEYNSKGEGANPKARATFSSQLKDLKDYDIETILGSGDGWNPIKKQNELLMIKR